VTKLLQTLSDSIAVGSLYALIALGYTLVYGVLRFINFAHSDVFMTGAWVSFVAASGFGWASADAPFWAVFAVLIVAMVACGVLGFTIERLAYRPLRKAPRLNVLITAIGVSLFLQNVGQLQGVFGTQPMRMPSLVEDRTLMTLGGVDIKMVDVMVVVLAVVLVGLLQWLVYRTRLGRAMRAVSYDERSAALMGVNVDMVISVCFVIGSALAAAAGLLYALKYPGLNQPAHATWVLLGLKAFVAAVVGGIGNVRGALVGALLIAFIEQFGVQYLSPEYRDVYVFAVLIAVLLLRPSGLMGRVTVEKV
jgi:branched-chain amino acid transport system permease protein